MGAEQAGWPPPGVRPTSRGSLPADSGCLPKGGADARTKALSKTCPGLLEDRSRDREETPDCEAADQTATVSCCLGGIVRRALSLEDGGMGEADLGRILIKGGVSSLKVGGVRLAVKGVCQILKLICYILLNSA